MGNTKEPPAPALLDRREHQGLMTSGNRPNSMTVPRPAVPKVPALSSPPLVPNRHSLCHKAYLNWQWRERNFSPYFINKELEALKGCHLPKVTQLAQSMRPGLRRLPDGIQFEERSSGEVSLAAQGHSDCCPPVGHATFTHGT